MKSIKLYFLSLFVSVLAFGQAGHIMQGVGAVNMSMGGAATAQPLDISGAMHWNPASISVFDQKVMKLDIGLFFSAPELSSTVPEFDNMGQPTGNFFSGTTKDDRGTSLMPALGMVWGKPEARSTFGVSAFGISGFGVTFPENMMNPINAPQNMGGFGRIESDYALMQIGFTWAYELTDNFSVGIQPTLNYATLKLMPNPTSDPTMAGYPSTDKATSIGYGAQLGVFYNNPSGFTAGASYKSPQFFQDFDFDNTFLDQSVSNNSFNMDYPSILSLGLGYSTDLFDFATDYRLVNYENTDGFNEVGWTNTAAVKGFGWENISIVSAGVQIKQFENLPFRLGYTYSSNPISSDVAFFNVPATAIIKNAVQFGFSYILNDQFRFDGLYHHGWSGSETSGSLLNPQFIGAFPPYGAIPQSEVAYTMKTDLITLGIQYTFK